MAYRVLAEIVLILHFCFVIFVVLGGLLVVRRPRLAWLHVPAVIWGVLIEFLWWTCPLTTFENRLRELGGEAGYEAGFIDYYVSAVLYAPLAPQMRITLGLLLVTFNLLIYLYLLRQYFFFREPVE